MRYLTEILQVCIQISCVLSSHKIYFSEYLDSASISNTDVYVFYVIPQTSIEECIESCQYRKRCHFVNFVPRANICQLFANDARPLSVVDIKSQLHKKPGYIFGIKEEWDLTEEGNCSTCSDLGTCSTDTSGLCLSSGCENPAMYETVVYSAQYLPGNRIKYYCNHGFKYHNVSTATCNVTGYWSHTDFICKHDCGPPVIQDGYYTPSDTTEGSTVNLYCDPGHIFSGSDSISCFDTGWNGSATCTLVDCGPPVISGGHYSPLDTTTWGWTVNLYCNPGHVFSGSDKITCLETGGWNGSATCTYTDCGDPTPENGITNGTIFAYGFVVKVSCVPGLALFGSQIITCQANGTWTDSSTCDCPVGVLFEQSCYTVAPKSEWTETRDYCSSNGGHLVYVDSMAEQTFLRNFIIASGNIAMHWIGGSDRATEGEYRWIDGTLIRKNGADYVFTNWSPGQPDDVFGGEDCMQIIPGGGFNYRWNDYKCTYSYYGLCENEIG